MAQVSGTANYDALVKSQKNQPDSVLFDKLNNFSFDMADAHRFDQVTFAAAKMSEMAETAGSDIWRGKVAMVLGYVEKYKNNTTAAISHYQKAQVLFQKSSDFAGEIRALQRIAGIYIDLNDPSLGESYLKRALKLAEKYHLENDMAFLYTDFATIEDLRKNYNASLKYNNEAVEILKKNGGGYIYTLFNQGIILKNAGRYKESIQVYLECLTFAKAHEDKAFEEFIYINLPRTYLKTNDLDKAEYYARKGLEMAPVSAEPNITYRECYEILKEIYYKKGNYKKAFDYQDQWVVYRDSIFNAEKSRQLIETELSFQTREKQQQIAQLHTDNKLASEKLLWLSLGSVVLVFLLGIALWQYRLIRTRNGQLKKTNETLSEANERIRAQASQLKELMQELHHRVKNNLAIVSSLLGLQAHRLDDERAAQAVTDGQQRVEAMSLIHNQLYVSDNVTGVSMQEYVSDLLRGLMQSFNYQENFDLKLDIEPVMLDVELAVPLGLILNELVTNAFKHAFPQVNEPQLTIRLWQDDKLYIQVKDNGPGVDVERWHKTGTSFGKRLIKSLTKQVKGEIVVSSIDGSNFVLTLPSVNGEKMKLVTT